MNPKHPGQDSYGDFFVQYQGEAASAVQKRVSDTLTKVMQQADDGQNVLAVSHGGAIHMFLLKWMDPEVKREKVHLGNCAVVKLTFADDKFHFEKVIDALNN